MTRTGATTAMAGLYKVTVTTALGCTSSGSKTISINASPNAVISNNSTCNRIWLIASGGNSYQWSGPNGFTTTGTTVLRNSPAANMWGTYTVTVTSNGCTSIASVTVIPCGGANKNAGDEINTSTLTAYPNPFAETTNIEFSVPQTTEATLFVYGMDGREVAQLFKGVAETGKQYSVQFESNHLPSGIYIVSLVGETGELQRYSILLSK